MTFKQAPVFISRVINCYHLPLKVKATAKNSVALRFAIHLNEFTYINTHYNHIVAEFFNASAFVSRYRAKLARFF